LLTLSIFQFCIKRRMYEDRNRKGEKKKNASFFSQFLLLHLFFSKFSFYNEYYCHEPSYAYLPK
jgi:hypothetical protein